MAPGAAPARAQAHQQCADFQHRKRTFLGKDDKSSAGGIDAHAREVCETINGRQDCFTTSSCSGRAYLWKGEGVKSTSDFVRYRVTHELIPEAQPYFDLLALCEEPADGAWEPDRRRTRERAPTSAIRPRPLGAWRALAAVAGRLCGGPRPEQPAAAALAAQDEAVWLRFEPFILHVCCRDFQAAAALIAAARRVFKNVGVQSWSEGKVTVAIWGDEGLEMALTDPSGRPLFAGHEEWLREQVNSRHRRNWAKIGRFTEAVRATPDSPAPTDADGPRPGTAADAAIAAEDCAREHSADAVAGSHRPRHFDVIGDVALLASAPEDPAAAAAAAAAVLRENRRVRIVAARRGALRGAARAPGGLDILAGPERRPLITTHSEFGVRYVVDLEAAFFSTRMGPERQRIAALVRPGERVCVLFAGCGPEALQIAAGTEAASVVAVELNAEAVRCARRSLELLAKRSGERAGRVKLLEGDVRAVAADLPHGSFHRVLAPRPKGATEAEDDALVGEFLRCALPLLGPGGCCHWYDFVADWEFPECARSVARIVEACSNAGRKATILRCSAANNKPVAERQYRTVIDFSVE